MHGHTHLMHGRVFPTEQMAGVSYLYNRDYEFYMVKCYAKDQKSSITSVDCRLPSMEDMRAAYPRAPPFFRGYEPTFKSKHQQAAWLFTALGRRHLWYSVYDGRQKHVEAVKQLPLETWLLGPPNRESARLATWFVDEPPHTDRRIMLHHSPLYIEDEDVGAFGPWSAVYMHRYVPMRHHRGGITREVRKITRQFLQEVLEAYAEGSHAVKNVMKDSGHPFVFSRGLPDH